MDTDWDNSCLRLEHANIILTAELKFDSCDNTAMNFDFFVDIAGRNFQASLSCQGISYRRFQVTSHLKCVLILADTERFIAIR